MISKRVLITGASGMVGYALCREAVSQDWRVWAAGRTDRHALEEVVFVTPDLTDRHGVTALLMDLRPDLVIHAAAITDKRECEQSPAMTNALHVDASRTLADYQAAHSQKFIYISTEAVYGKGTQAHREDDECHPSGLYAETKLLGEQAVLAVNAAALVLRGTPVGFAPGLLGKNLVEWLLRSFRERQPVNGFTDAVFTPITSFQLARFIFSDAATNARGLFNIGCEPAMTKYDLALGLCRRLGFDEFLVNEAVSPAHMAGNAAVSSRRLAALGRWQPPTPEKVLDDLAAEFKNSSLS